MGRSLDAATAYFNVQGFQLLRDGLVGLGSFRLLLGDEPTAGGDVGLGPRPRAAAALRGELDAAPYSEETLRAVEELIAFLRRPRVAVRAYSAASCMPRRTSSTATRPAPAGTASGRSRRSSAPAT